MSFDVDAETLQRAGLTPREGIVAGAIQSMHAAVMQAWRRGDVDDATATYVDTAYDLTMKMFLNAERPKPNLRIVK